MIFSILWNNLFDNNQSGFQPKNSCVNQLKSITRSIFSASDVNSLLEVCGVFLDLSKAFDKVLHDGLLYKLQNNEIGSNLFCLIKSCLHDRHQRVVINGQSSI